MNYLIVPFRIEALVLEEGINVCPPVANFKELPWYDPKDGQINPQNPYLGSTISHKPFGASTLPLPSGVHLHFIIPPFLGKVNEDFKDSAGAHGKAPYPPIPNRWIITKKETGKENKTWIVESDYVYQEAEESPKSSGIPTIIPVSPYRNPDTDTGKPYRYMGRQTPGNETPSMGDGTNFMTLYHSELTVLGYGNINFTSFYPNCLGSLGFYDSSVKTPSPDISYSVAGFYSNLSNDFLNKLVSNYQKSVKENPKMPALDFNNLLKSRFDLSVQNNTENKVYDSTIFYAEFNLNEKPAYIANDYKQVEVYTDPHTSEKIAQCCIQINKDALSIAIGNTGTEALSAMVANKMVTDKLPNAINKETIEGQLESLLLLPKLSGKITDLMPKFLEARHEKGFTPVDSGTIWTLVKKDAATDDNLFQKIMEALPEEVVSKLTELNDAQLKYDNSRDEIACMKEQLHLDWCKYMKIIHISNQGNSDWGIATSIYNYVLSISPNPIGDKSKNTGLLIISEKKDTVTKSSDSDSNSSSLADTVIEKLGALITSLNTLIPFVIEGKSDKKFVDYIKPLISPSERFWKPNEPVLLINGLVNDTDLITTGLNLSNCLKLETNEKINLSGNFKDSLTFISQSIAGFAKQSLSNQKWKPFIMDWQISLYPTNFYKNTGNEFIPNSLVDANISGTGGNFALDESGPDFVKMNYQELGDDNPLKKNQYENVFKGTTIISNSSLDFFNKAIENYKPADNTDVRYDVAKNALTVLTGINIWSQAMGGFNSACLMRSQTPQIPVCDTLPDTEDNLTLFRNIEQICKGILRTSYEPMFYFNPLRSGTLKNIQLRFIDNFGLPSIILKPVDNDVIKTSTIQDGINAFMRPRVIQPSRLNFKWVTDNNEECNFLKSSTPICGWLIPNFFDKKIMVYDHTGIPLGFLDETNSWNLPPYVSGTPNAETLGIENIHLRNIVKKMLAGTTGFINTFQNALNNIAPSSPGDETLALFIGRPIAVVRTKLSFQLKGLPVLDQSLDAANKNKTKKDWIDRVNEIQAWTSVKFPYRLGEHTQLNDGLVGYWLENGNEYPDPFYAPQTSPASLTNEDKKHIKTFGSGSHLFHSQSFADGEQLITMLIDPEGRIHATTGILPVKSIVLPPSSYQDTLNKMNVWFEIGPLIQPDNLMEIKDKEGNTTEKKDEVFLDLPNLENYQWDWYDKTGIKNQLKNVPGSLTLQERIRIINGYLNLQKQQEK